MVYSVRNGIRSRSAPPRLQLRLLEDPVAQDLETLLVGFVTQPSLMALLLPGLDIQWLPKEQAPFGIRRIDPGLQLAVIRQQLGRPDVTYTVGPVLVQCRNSARNSMARDARLVVPPADPVHFSENVVSEVQDVSNELFSWLEPPGG